MIFESDVRSKLLQFVSERWREQLRALMVPFCDRLLVCGARGNFQAFRFLSVFVLFSIEHLSSMLC